MIKPIHFVFLGMALLFMVSAPAWSSPAAGKKVFLASKCQICHYTRGPAREKTIANQLAKRGPELWYAGSKFQKPWLQKWLQRPTPIRRMKYNSLTQRNPGRHAKLSAKNAAAVTAYLMSLKSSVVKSGVIKPRKHPKGRLIFKKKMPCGGCHQYPDRGAKKGGRTGPSLVGAGTRLNPDWIYAYLKHPKVFKPVKMMPVFSGILSDTDMKFVSAYVATFK